MYNELILNVKDYFKYRVNRHGLKYLLKLTSSYYPKILALGVCYHSNKEIVICKIFNHELRLEHERGHARGLGHTMKIGYVMNPYGILRGNKY